MLLKIILVVISSLFLVNASSCNKKVDAYRCILISVDENGNRRQLKDWYWYCINTFSGNKKTIPISESNSCIRDRSSECKFLGTDISEEKRIKEHYSRECSK